MNSPDEDFIRNLTDWQNRLFGYLTTILGNVHDARDVLQETNLVIWRKMEEFEPGTNFGAWAKKCAHYQALAFLRDRKRDRHVFDEETLAKLADETGPRRSAGEEEKEVALLECLAALPDAHRRMLRDRYREGMSIRELATSIGKKSSATKMTLMRIRETLLVCIEGKLAQS
ncbi:MAG: sigma-70 family RNA polymerase sigma factor [Verrucomicrobiales bacterium]|nr:sigma-70 family RNA polymerase sigma factor [Verrucomicrobiales bacterium]